MNKFKKVFTSFCIFFGTMISKVLVAVDVSLIESGRMVEDKYGVFEPTIVKISKIGKIALPFVLFIIGLFVIFNKKIAEKVKLITISTLLAIGVLSWVILNYISNNY